MKYLKNNLLILFTQYSRKILFFCMTCVSADLPLKIVVELERTKFYRFLFFIEVISKLLKLVKAHLL